MNFSLKYWRESVARIKKYTEENINKNNDENASSF